jgi:hypothetical protein
MNLSEFIPYLISLSVILMSIGFIPGVLIYLSEFIPYLISLSVILMSIGFIPGVLIYLVVVKLKRMFKK